MRVCSRCSGERIVYVSGKCADLCCVSVDHLGLEGDGYVPDFIGEYGDYVQVEFCADCGQIQHFKPISDNTLLTQVKGM